MTRKRRPRTIVPALERSIRAASWIEATDEGAQKTAVRLADDLDRIDDLLGQIDRGVMFSDPKTTSDLIGKRAYLASTLLGYLKQLSLTPETRKAGDGDGSDPIDVLRRLVGNPGDVPGMGSGGSSDAPGIGDAADRDGSSGGDPVSR